MATSTKNLKKRISGKGIECDIHRDKKDKRQKNKKNNNTLGVMINTITSKGIRRLPSSDQSVHSDATSATEMEKSVSFCETVAVHQVMTCDDYTLDEIEASWYSRDDYAQIRSRCHHEIFELNQGIFQWKNDAEFCARGLERATTVGVKARRENRCLAYQAVLGVQASQMKQGTFDDEAIAEAYRLVSFSCQLLSYVVGSRDREAANRYLHKL